MKNTTQQPLKLKWAGPIDKNGNFQLKWVYIFIMMEWSII